ncbi:(Fe-S)-binding protein [Campylobacter sp. RM12327]|uniref:(Fe-S)-binding protein n=1 Tax=Campylobacter sputorum TaxID=206 RepID=UPI000B774012|nr:MULTISPECIES: (Fe-S)-binding protein [Campylobacter]MBE7357311.1 (Fe-S)-binding protein [Campylobacter sp. RM11302]MBF6668621.1 (Fe-S)-binding protein [Campylobacter sp. RM12327]MBF6674123.1 (Fe-S)-binding protein [Campylobacter sp. RM13538]MBF6675592.1 (Fe-S)-binding protein [Campylobacter sp. RM12321]MBF6677422.1 (Fe-S)-binding protein [Campylobacter sp. RM11259]
MYSFNFEEISTKCVKCGKCIQVCTIYGINKDEVTSPRGYLDLLGACNNGSLKLDKNLKNIFESCFLCTNCVEVCPNSLRVDTAIENIRYEIAKTHGVALYKKAAFWLLGHRKILDLCARLGYVFQSCAFKIHKDNEFGNTMKARFSIPMLKKERTLPTASKKSFMNSHEEFIDNGGEKTVGLFIGCMGNYAYTNIGESVLKIAKELKLNVHLMKKQACCGAAAYFTGCFKEVEKAAKFNIPYFEKMLESLDAIIIPEATCSAMIKIDYVHFFHNDKNWQERAKKVSQKIFLATEYFDKFTNLGEILSTKSKINKTLTYHDPCHAKKMQGVFKEPRNLLSKNYDFVEIDDQNSCCGFGGVTMQTGKYHLSREVGIKRAEQINKTNASIVSAECSACRMQLSNALNLIDSKTKFKNPIELIAEVL